jgi:hypothetical protein
MLAHLIPHARLFTIDDGHLFLITRANEVAPVIMRFLAEPMIEDGKVLGRRSFGVRLRRLARRLRRVCRQGGLLRERARQSGVKFGPKLKLNSHQIQEIRKRKEAGESCRFLARSYGVSPNTISRIKAF